MQHPNRPSKLLITANLIGTWLCILAAGFYVVAWLVPPGQYGSPMDLRPINPAIASGTAFLWSVTTLLLALPSFGSHSVRFRAAVTIAPILALTLVFVAVVRA